MRVIICGAGQVGFNIAGFLSREENDVTVIDRDPAQIARVNDELDASGVLGHAASPDSLQSAGAEEADMIIAVTDSDEVNMVACQVGHSLFNIPRKIARIREHSYLDPAWANLFSRSHLPIDLIISPEQEIAKAIIRRLSVPGTTDVRSLAGGEAYLCGVMCQSDCPLVNTPLSQLNELFPGFWMSIVGISRGGQLFVPGGDDQIMIGDEAFFIAGRDHIDRILAAFGHAEEAARSVVIMGGGNIGVALTRLIKEELPGLSLKLIELDADRAQSLSEENADLLIFQGDALNSTIMHEVGLRAEDTFIAVSNDDEANILGSLLALHQGSGRTITLVNRPNYNELMGSLKLGAVVSPRAVTVATIMQYVRRGRIKAIHPILDGQAEVIEAEISDASGMSNKTIAQLALHRDIKIGAILRDGQILPPSPDFLIKAQDRVIAIAARGKARKAEKMFSVQVDLF